MAADADTTSTQTVGTPVRHLVREPLGDSAFVMVAMPLTIIAAIVVGLILRVVFALGPAAVG